MLHTAEPIRPPAPPRACCARARSHRAAVAAGVLALALTACMDATGVPGAAGGTLDLAVTPRLHRSATHAGGPVDRVRLNITEVGTGTSRGALLEDVDPDAPEWTLAVQVERPQSPVTALVIAIELLRVEGADEVVEWSGLSAPIRIGLDQTLQHALVDLFPGPLANLDVESLQILAPGEPVTEGDTIRLAFDVRGGGAGVRVILASLDPAVADVEPDGRVVARAPGSARLVAQAGPRSDTLRLAVREWPLAAAGPVTAFLPAMADAGARLVGGLSDGARSAPIRSALADLQARLAERRGALAAESLRSAAAALAAYGGAAPPADGPDLGALWLTLEHAARLLGYETLP